MFAIKSAWAAHWPTGLFVLLWSSGALFARWGLDHASAFAFLALRFALAIAVLVALSPRRWLPSPGNRLRVAAVGLILVGGYSVCYLLALANGLTPGVLATLLGVQPILTLLLMERRLPLSRLLGLGMALAGLSLVVWDSVIRARFSALGVLFALAALACNTAGAIGQKRITEAPTYVLPLQYAVSLALCLMLIPLQPVRVDWSWGLAGALLGMGVVISVVATLLLYRLIRHGNLVNVTSLFYLVPGGTALLDWLVLGNRMALGTLMGLGAIVIGLVLVLRSTPDGTHRALASKRATL